MTTYEIPLGSNPQSFSVTFPNGGMYQMRLIYQFNDDACWLLDIADSQSNPLVSGVPLVTGADLLEQYAYLGLGVAMYATTDADATEPPHWWNLGTTGHLYIVAP